MNLATPRITPTKWTRDGHAPADLIVACVCYGPKYPDEYVLKLQSAVARNLTLPHEFICLSDRVIDGVTCQPLHMVADSWWHKVQLFSRDTFRPGARVLYLDLDVVITGSIDHLACQIMDAPLAMIFNFGPNRVHCAHNSSVMLWTAGDPRVAAIYDLFTSDVPRKLHGDQCWIWRVLQDDIANWDRRSILSYKYDCRGRAPADDCAVVVFHGDPKPALVRQPWVQQHWR